MGLSDWASYDQNGNPVPSPVFPYRLVFRPAANLSLPHSYTG